MARKDLQVIEIGEGWAVRRQGELMLLSVHDQADEAEQAAIERALIDHVDVYVQGRDGRFRRSSLVQEVGKRPRQPPRPSGGTSR